MFIKIFGQFKEIREEFHNNLHRNVFTGGMSLCQLQSGQTRVEWIRQRHRKLLRKRTSGCRKSVNAGGFLRKNDTQSQIEARRNNAKKQALKVVSDAWKSDNKSAGSIADMEGLKQSKVSEMNEIRAKMKDIENTKNLCRKSMV